MYICLTAINIICYVNDNHDVLLKSQKIYLREIIIKYGKISLAFDKEMRIAKRRIYEQSDRFKERYRWRAGVEATMLE